MVSPENIPASNIEQTKQIVFVCLVIYGHHVCVCVLCVYQKLLKIDAMNLKKSKKYMGGVGKGNGREKLFNYIIASKKRL